MSQNSTEIPRLFPLAMTFIAIVVALLVLIPTTREQVRAFFLNDKRVILSSVQGDLFNNGSVTKVLKVRRNSQLFLEIYQSELNQNTAKLFQRILLGRFHDGHLVLKGKTANLVLDDVNHDGQLDIVAPTFEKLMVATLNVFTYSSTKQQFIELN